MNKVFRFMRKDGRGYKVAIHARTLRRARQYVKDRAISELAYRDLEYVGEGHPSDTHGWVGVVADKPEPPDWMLEPVTIPEGWGLDKDGVLMETA